MKIRSIPIERGFRGNPDCRTPRSPAKSQPALLEEPMRFQHDPTTVCNMAELIEAPSLPGPSGNVNIWTYLKCNSVTIEHFCSSFANHVI